MYLRLLLCIVALLPACACGAFRKDHKVQDPKAERLDALRTKRDLYLKLLPTQQDVYGNVVSKGDGLLWSCLAYASGATVNFSAYEREVNGRWYRHPEWAPGTPTERWSSISRDMVNGLFYCFWTEARKNPAGAKDYVSRFISYGTSHKKDLVGWVVGEHGANERDEERVMLTPTSIATMYELSAKVGGPDDKEARAVPQVWDPHAVGFAAHLEVLSQNIRGLMQGAINGNELDYLRSQAEANPKNAEYQAVYHLFKDGDMTTAVDALLDESLFPADHLPTTDNYCADYLFQRGQFNRTNDTADSLSKSGKDPEATNPDWLPCPGEGLTHSGVELLFTSALIFKELNGQ